MRGYRSETVPGFGGGRGSDNLIFRKCRMSDKVLRFLFPLGEGDIVTFTSCRTRNPSTGVGVPNTSLSYLVPQAGAPDRDFFFVWLESVPSASPASEAEGAGDASEKVTVLSPSTAAASMETTIVTGEPNCRRRCVPNHWNRLIAGASEDDGARVCVLNGGAHNLIVVDSIGEFKISINLLGVEKGVLNVRLAYEPGVLPRRLAVLREGADILRL
jgi:hypothetical protein